MKSACRKPESGSRQVFPAFRKRDRTDRAVGFEGFDDRETSADQDDTAAIAQDLGRAQAVTGFEVWLYGLHAAQISRHQDIFDNLAQCLVFVHEIVLNRVAVCSA